MPQKFNEVKIDRRDKSEKVLRSVMIDQFTADTLNGDEKVTGIKYVLAEVPKQAKEENPPKVEKTPEPPKDETPTPEVTPKPEVTPTPEDEAKKAEKVKREGLFKILKDAGKQVPGITKTDKLEQMVAELNKI